jgi:hypothetical protein
MASISKSPDAFRKSARCCVGAAVGHVGIGSRHNTECSISLSDFMKTPVIGVILPSRLHTFDR